MQSIAKRNTMDYIYALDYMPVKFMNCPSIEETYYFWKEQKTKGINVQFFDYPISLVISGDSLDDCNKKFEKFRKELFLHNPDLDAMLHLSALDIKRIERKLKQRKQ